MSIACSPERDLTAEEFRALDDIRKALIPA
jgi:hypothetical protein